MTAFHLVNIHQMAPPWLVVATIWLLLRLLLNYRPREDERLSWPWLTYSGRFRHINGYPSAAGQVQARESPQVKDRRTSTELHHQLKLWMNVHEIFGGVGCMYRIVSRGSNGVCTGYEVLQILYADWSWQVYVLSKGWPTDCKLGAVRITWPSFIFWECCTNMEWMKHLKFHREIEYTI